MNDFDYDPTFEPRLRVISLGGGVQSSMLALAAARGEIGPMPDCAIFADTQAEPEAVYKWLDWLERQLPYPVYRVTAGDLLKSATRVRTSKKTGNKYIATALPVHMADGLKRGMGQRHCTRDFKIHPIQRKVRELLGLKRISKSQAPIVEMWIGISLDEAVRMKPSVASFIRNRWPLIEREESREDCNRWMDRHGFPRAPRSACTFCPFHDDAEWAALLASELASAVVAETALQRAYDRSSFDGVPFLHESRVPLDQVKFAPKAKTEQLHMRLGKFANECEGMCGV